MNKMNLYLLAAALILLPVTSQAYVGPALAGSTIAVILGLFASVAFALFTVVWYPIKQLRRKKKQAQDPSSSDSAE